MKKKFAVLGVLAVAAFASAASAQGGGGMAGMKMDEQKAVTQEGPTPAGWSLRPDNPASKPESVNFVTMGPGMHVTSGNTAAIYWNPANTASGTYTISGTFGVRSTPLHDAVGLIWGGNDLSGDKESYAYFLVYGDGGFTVKHRSGPSSAMRNNPDVHTLVTKAMNPAIKAAPADGGSASNKLAVKVAADSVRFFVNDVQVAAVDTKNPMVPSSGIYGFRVNHGISVHIAGLAKQ
jgi:hypothetical protein